MIQHNFRRLGQVFRSKAWVLGIGVVSASLVAGCSSAKPEASSLPPETTEIPSIQPTSVTDSSRQEKDKPEKRTTTMNSPADSFPPDSSLERIERSEDFWRLRLDKLQYNVTREKGTERAFTGKYWDNKKQGVYRCVCCNLPLFASETKYKSGTGWPSFYQPIAPKNVTEKLDKGGLISGFFMGDRTEIVCTRCEAHLGHVFDDGPKPTGKRYCMNSAALNFVEKKTDTEEKK